MKKQAFTLIELLVVIGILIVLMALISGGGVLAMKKSKIQKAQTEIMNVLSAVNMYRSDIGIMPKDATLDRLGKSLSKSMIFGVTDYSTIFGPYFEFKENNSRDTGSNSNKELIDPWGNPYHYFYPAQLNKTPAPAGLPATGTSSYKTLDNGFPIVFSNGPDGNMYTDDDIGTWK
ncbi:MAG: type II secretion system protein GspG [Candidatus Aureabacteria bacterium]|nr:type II secretion system protein GspG [Candidatus Auribacterota bacterium]